MIHRGRQRLRVEQAAARAKVSGRTVFRALNSGELTRFRQGAKYTLLDVDEVDDWSRSRIKPDPPNEREAA
jgi:excisionase family DNA binding protein